MTSAAREVLDACRGAVDDLAGGIQGAVWRRRWVTAVVLLRSVGHVLDKVDSQQSTAYAQVIRNAWRSLVRAKPDPPIFWDFIDSERNNILKENHTGAGQGVTIHVGQEPSATYQYLMYRGAFQGRDQRDLLRDAIDWWESYLNDIDTEANRLS